MRLMIAREVRRKPNAWEAYSLFLVIGAALYFPFWLGGVIELPFESPLRYLGFACPLCGGSRAVGSLVLGRLGAALSYNPLALLLLLALLYGALSYLLFVLPFGRRVQLHASRTQWRVFWTLVVVVFVANWAYVLYSGMYREPMQL